MRQVAGGSELQTEPLPALHEWAVRDEWRAIDLISDLHLCEAMPRTFEAWAAHLKNTSADCVIMLGDLFEVWVGDDMRTLPFQRTCMRVMAEVATHKQLAFMAGNRDFLVGASMLQDSAVMLLPDPTLLDAWGRRVLLSHGDALCLADGPYQAFRSQVRSADWQRSFLSRTLEQRLAIAADMRRASSARRAFDGDGAIDVDAVEAVRWMSVAGVGEMVHGHTHRPGSDTLAPGFERHVLSDWNLDGDDRAEVLRLTRRGFSRSRPVAV